MTWLSLYMQRRRFSICGTNCTASCGLHRQGDGIAWAPMCKEGGMAGGCAKEPKRYLLAYASRAMHCNLCRR